MAARAAEVKQKKEVRHGTSGRQSAFRRFVRQILEISLSGEEKYRFFASLRMTRWAGADLECGALEAEQFTKEEARKADPFG